MKKRSSFLLLLATSSITTFAIFLKLRTEISTELLLYFFLIIGIVLVGFGMVAYHITSSRFDEIIKDCIPTHEKDTLSKKE